MTKDGTPARLLLATDLSARCDRALDRSTQLAAEWRAQLVALKVLETPQAPDHLLAWAAGEDEESRLQAAKLQLQRDIGSLGVEAEMRLAQGEPAETIRRIAADAGCDLIVSGMARNEALGRFLLGSTVERLARSVLQPLLVVRNRVHGPYRRIIIATDFSASARYALQTAARFFPDRELTLYHAYKTPMSGLADRMPQAQPAHEIDHPECTAFIAAADLPPQTRGKLKVIIGQGALETQLTHYVRAHEVDLVVMGTNGRSGLKGMLIGSMAARLLDWLPCDTMIVRDPDTL